MSTLTLLLIRHAEKPGGEWLGPGLTVDGSVDNKSLVVRGWQRAGALAALFVTATTREEYPRPIAIYAANPDDDNAGSEPSRRPYQTIIPLTQRLFIEPVTTFAKGQEQDLATSLSGLTGVILVSWEHKAIVNALLPALGATQKIPGVPSKWDDARFDVILRLDRAVAGAPWSLRQLFPCLLSGDSEVPL